MSVGIVTCLLFAAISINMRSVECGIKKEEAGISKSEKIMSVQERSLWDIWEAIKKIGKGIYPGTNWCGVGNVAKNGSEFGTSEQTDRCCKAHDECETFITAGDTKYGLKNNAIYTVSGCDCDEKLLDCMVSVASSETFPADDKKTANDFGWLFFNVISPKCLKEDYPLVCAERWFGICTSYEKDTNQTKVWQLVKGPTFPTQ